MQQKAPSEVERNVHKLMEDPEVDKKTKLLAGTMLLVEHQLALIRARLSHMVVESSGTGDEHN